jgi:hypothetical protein
VDHLHAPSCPQAPIAFTAKLAESVFAALDSAVPAGWQAGRGEGYELVLPYPDLAASASAMSGLIRLDRDARRHFARQVQARTSGTCLGWLRTVRDHLAERR